jgi:hypothetical protein
MLKINALYSRAFPNDLHMQSVTEIKNLTQSHNPAVLGIANQHDEFVLWYNRENKAFEYVRRSEYTAEKEKVDHDRDLTYTGMFDYVKASTNHYEPAIAVSARRLMLVVESSNSPERIIDLPYDAKTASVNALINNLYAQPADIAQIGLQGWLTALQTKNNAFETLALQHINTTVGKPEYNMINSRRGIEKAMHTMFNCINALIIMNGETAYTDYVNALNAIIKHYNDVNATRLGHYEANKNKKNEQV